MPTSEVKTVAIGLGFLVFFAATFAHQRNFDSLTPVSRLDLMHALLKGHFYIDAYHEGDSSHGATPDKAIFKGHYYSDKAPGTVAFALPMFALTAALLHISRIPLDSRWGWLFSSWLTSAGSLAVFTALGAVAMFLWLTKYVQPRFALITSVTLFLGAAPLPYATMMFSHSLVVGLLAIAIRLIDRSPQTATERRREMTSDTNVDGQWHLSNQRMDMAAGFCCGSALASEFSSGLVVVGIALWLLCLNWRRVPAFSIAAVPPLLLIPLYNWTCFGNPFILPYSRPYLYQMEEGLFSIKSPDIQIIFNLLFGPTRGLIFWTPYLMLAVEGFVALWRLSRTFFWISYIIPLVHLTIISGKEWDWEAGPTIGPRYLAPLLPLLALPCALGLARHPKIGVVLAGYSILITTLATLTNACSPSSVYSPLTQLHLPMVLRGDFSPNWARLLGIGGYTSIALFYAAVLSGILYLWRRCPTPSGPEFKNGSCTRSPSK